MIMKMDDKMDGVASLATPTSPEHHNMIRLACQACQRKKIKCDRNFPCGQCTRSNLQCTPSTRKPRARHTGKRAVDSELRNRISKLESLVENLSGEVGANGIDDDELETQAEHKDPNASRVGKYIGSSFWSSLTGEVQALKEALEEAGAEDDEPTSPATSTVPGNPAEYDLIVCPPGSVYVMPGALQEPSHQQLTVLFQAFCSNIDRMFKLYHTPSLRAMVVDGQSYLGHEANAPCNKALKAAICFAATNTLSENQCIMMFGQTRHDALQQLRKLVDIALAQADLMNTNDLATLQAFATYIVTSRLTDPSRRMWTMTAILVRLARALGLNTEEEVPHTPYEREIRRRLWHNIRFLDVFTSWDRSSEILITNSSFDTPRPLNVNDSDFDESSTTIVGHEAGLTDMSFANLAYETTHYTHRLLMPESKPNGGDTWQDRLESATELEKRSREKFVKYLDTSDPFQAVAHAIALSMASNQKLRAVRPLRKHPLSQPPRVDSEYVLRLARDSLKYGEEVYAVPNGEQFRWMIWVPWHPLAVALAGLCSMRDTELANDAWIHVERVYTRQSQHVADARNGMLWRPIEKLYKKASAFRDHREETPSDSSSTAQMPTPAATTHPAAFSPNNQNTTTAFTLPPFDPSLGPLQISSQTIPGAMPTSGVMNSPMNLDFSSSATGGLMGDFDLMNNNMNWMDYQNIFEDMATPAPQDANTNPWPQSVPQSDGWGNLQYHKII